MDAGDLPARDTLRLSKSHAENGNVCIYIERSHSCQRLAGSGAGPELSFGRDPGACDFWLLW